MGIEKGSRSVIQAVMDDLASRADAPTTADSTQVACGFKVFDNRASALPGLEEVVAEHVATLKVAVIGDLRPSVAANLRAMEKEQRKLTPVPPLAPGPEMGVISVRKDAVAMCMGKEARQNQRSSLMQVCFREVSVAVKSEVPRQERRKMARNMAKQFHRQVKAQGAGK